MPTQAPERTYTKFDNGLLAALYTSELSGQELRAMLYVVRWTSGCHKDNGFFPLPMISKALGIHHIRAQQLMAGLVDRGWLLSDATPGKVKRYTLNKNIKGK